MCRNKFKGNNHFDSRNFTNLIWAQETPETRKSSKGLSVTLCVKSHIGTICHLQLAVSESPLSQAVIFKSNFSLTKPTDIF